MPDEEQNITMGDVFSDSSEDSDFAKEEKKVVVEEPVVKFSAMTREE